MIEEWRSEANANRFGFTIDDETIIEALKLSMAMNNSDLIVMESQAGRVLGLLGCLVCNSPINKNEKFLNEHMWYVLPEHRSGMSLEMIEIAEMIGRDHGCGNMCMTASNLISNEHDKVVRLYRKMGFVHFETTFIRRISQ